MGKEMRVVGAVPSKSALPRTEAVEQSLARVQALVDAIKAKPSSRARSADTA